MQTFSRNYSSQRHPRLAVPNRKRRLPPYVKLAGIAVCLLIIFLIAKVTFMSNNDQPESAANQAALTTEHEKTTEQSEPSERHVNTVRLQGELNKIIEQYPYDTSTTVIDLNSGALLHAGEGYSYIAASTTKLLTAILYLSAVETGQESMDTIIGGKPARQQLELTINLSDNFAWHKLNSHLTTSRLDAYAEKQGLMSYDTRSNTITSDDMARLTAKLYKGELLNEEHTKLLLSWMQDTSEERFIPAAVPDGTALYHKAGYLPDRVHDVAVVDNGSAPFVIVIFTKSSGGSYDYTIGQKLFRQLTEQVVTTFK